MGLRGHGAVALTVIGCVAAGFVAPTAASAGTDAEPGWAQRALDLQYELASDVGFVNTPWVGTHNSYNSTVQAGVTLSAQDANQEITNVEQLDAGIRSLELDVHRVPDVPGGPLRVCHGRGADQAHFGCTIEKPLDETLAEIAGWLATPANSDQVLLLYLEDHMGDAAGYDDAADVVGDELGEMLFAPSEGGCSEVPASLTRDAVRAAGKQVVIVSDCGPGTGWAQVAFNWDSHVESRPVGYADFPDCGPDYDRATYDSKLVRYFEDRTALTNQVGPPTGVATPDDGITPQTAAAMARCGVDLIGMDLISGPADRRLEALVWSWKTNRPRAPEGSDDRNCAIQRQGVAVSDSLGGGERSAWLDKRCRRLNRPACRAADGTWSIPGKARRFGEARAACERRGLALGAPRTGYESQQLGAAMDAAGAGNAWLGHRLRGGEWQPTAPR